MKLRTIAGFGVGYVLGARSQSQETSDPQELVKAVTQSDAFKTVLEQARQLAASGMEALTGHEPSWAPQDDGSSGSEESSSSGGGEEGSSDESSSESNSSESSSSGSS